MTVLLFIFLFGLMFIGVPIAFSLILSGAGFLVITNFRPLIVVAQRIMTGMDSFPILAISMFIFTGFVMESTSISKRLVNCIQAYFGHLKGSIGIITIISCTLFAALTGSGPATVAAVGSTLYPSMLNVGYKKYSAAGLLAAGGALGPIIPPSVIMIVYGATMGVSITDMFLGSIIPGLLFALILIFVNKLILRNKNIDTGTEKYTFKDKLYATKSAFGALLLPVIILGGIYGGIFTPTEAAATGSVYSLIIGLLYKDLDKKKLISILKRTVETSSCVILVVGVSSVFSWLVTVTRVPNVVSEIILSNITNKYVYLAVLTVLLFLVGALLDGLVNVVILAPIVVPAGISLGVDPLHMGVLFCVCLVVGFITPPFGINLFTSASVSKLSYGEVVKGALPYMIGLAIGSVIVVFVPVLSLFLLNII